MFTATAFYTPSQFSGSRGLMGDASQYGVTGLVDAHDVRLNVTASKSEYDQQSLLSGQLANDQFAFQERLSIYLPLNFRTDFYYRILDNQSTISEPLAPQSRELYGRQHGSRGDPLAPALPEPGQPVRLSARHERFVRRGLDVGLQFARIRLRQADRARPSPGRVEPGNDPHGQQRADGRPQRAAPGDPRPGELPPRPTKRRSGDPRRLPQVAVAAVSDHPPRGERPLHRDAPRQHGFRSRCSCCPRSSSCRGPTTSSCRTPSPPGPSSCGPNSYGFNTSVQLLDNMLTPYYSYLAVRSEILSGVFPGIPSDSTTNTVGLNFLDGPWRAVGEFQSLDWDVSPYHQWRGEVQYVGAIDPTLRVYATANVPVPVLPERNLRGRSHRLHRTEHQSCPEASRRTFCRGA